MCHKTLSWCNFNKHFDSSKMLEVVAQDGFMDEMQKTELGEMAQSVRTAMATP